MEGRQKKTRCNDRLSKGPSNSGRASLRVLQRSQEIQQVLFLLLGKHIEQRDYSIGL
jgi:hypothetical protein